VHDLHLEDINADSNNEQFYYEIYISSEFALLFLVTEVFIAVTVISRA
jgi:hypothetical protein